jgi:DNA ligase-1
MADKFKTMRAGTLDPNNLKGLRFPLLASPKMDGIRCVIRGGKALSRRLVPLPNQAARHLLEAHPGFEGLDGELMVHGAPLEEISSCFMGRNRALPSGWYYAVFDAAPLTPSEPYEERIARATRAVSAAALYDHVLAVPQTEIANLAELEIYEAKALELGFEGVMLRRAAAAYKFGESRLSDSALLKLKRFVDAEAEIIGFLKRAGKGPGSLDALKVRDLKTQVEFPLFLGFSEEQRTSFWRDRKAMRGQIAKYKHFSFNTRKKPRYPSFISLRAKEDM